MIYFMSCVFYHNKIERIKATLTFSNVGNNIQEMEPFFKKTDEELQPTKR